MATFCTFNQPLVTFVKIFIGLCSLVANVSGITAVVLPGAMLGVWNDIVIALLTVNVILAVLAIIDECASRRCLINTWICLQMIGLFTLVFLVWQSPHPCLIVSCIVAGLCWILVVFLSIVHFKLGPALDKTRWDSIESPTKTVGKDLNESPPPTYDELIASKKAQDTECPPPSYDEL